MSQRNETAHDPKADDSVQSVDPSRVLDWGSLFGKWVFTRTTADTNGAYLEAHVAAPVGESPPLYIHYHAEESYQVLAGTLEVRLGKEWQQVSAGQTLTVPRGTPHTLRGSAPVELINVHRRRAAAEGLPLRCAGRDAVHQVRAGKYHRAAAGSGHARPGADRQAAAVQAATLARWTSLRYLTAVDSLTATWYAYPVVRGPFLEYDHDQFRGNHTTA